MTICKGKVKKNIEIFNDIWHEGRGSRMPLTFLSKKFFLKDVFRTHKVWALYYIHIAVEVTMNLAEYTRSWQSATGAGEECQYLNHL